MVPDLHDASPSAAMQAFLRPRSVAVVGATERPGFAATTLRNAVGSDFRGSVHPVNPNYEQLAGLPCHPSLKAVPDPVDLALVVVPAAAVPGVLEDCGAVGVKAAIIYSSGFAETGPEGQRLQERVLATARERGIRLLGPNCMGLFHQPSGLVASFTSALNTGLLPGSGAAYVGQSGAIGGAVLGMAKERGFGLTTWASTGNEMDLSVAEIAEGLVESDDIRVVAAYLESIPDGETWSRLTARVQELGKHLVVLRSGRSEAGRRAAASHTGAMVRPDAAFTLLNHERGVVSVDDVASLVDAVEVLVRDRRPPGPRIAVVTSSGGVGSLMADHIEEAGLRLAELKPRTQEELGELIPAYGSVANPVDVTAQLFTQGDRAFEAACSPLVTDENVDALVIVLTTVTGERAVTIAEGIVRLAAGTTKPVAVVWAASHEETLDGRRVLRTGGVPVTSSVPGQIALLQKMSQAVPVPVDTTEPDRTRALPGDLVDELFAAPATVTEAAGARLLDALGIPRPEAVLATSEQDAVAAADRLRAPLVFKVQSPQIAHKSDVHGVRVGVAADQAAAAYRQIRSAGEAVAGAQVEGVLVQEMAAPGTELIVGVRGSRDGYPPVVTVGIGGVATEIYADVVSASAPVTRERARELLRGLRGWPLLDGYRGRQRVAVDAVVDAVVALSRAAVELGERLDELEINPLVVDASGISALDLLIRSRGAKRPDSNNNATSNKDD